MEKDYTIAEEYLLPSKGLIYDGIQFDPEIKLRSMTVRDDMKRQGPSKSIHKNLCELIDGCLLTKLPISSYDMFIGDYEYLLHKLRVVSYGPEYKVLVTCPHCFSTKETVLNLDDLKVIECDPEEFKNALEFKLPKSGDDITIKFETPRILDNIDQKVKEFKRKNPDATYDPSTLITLQELIDTVNGNKLKYVELETYINNLNVKDGNFILNKILKVNKMIGLDTSANVSCATCGGDIKTYFQFGQEFFRPSND